MKELVFPIPYLKESAPVDQAICVGDDIFIATCVSLKKFKRLLELCHIDDLVAVYCKSNSLRCRVDFEEFNISEGMMIMKLPSKSICISEENGKDIDLIVMIISKQYLANHKLDIINMLNEVVSVFNNPCFSLIPEERSLFEQHISLLSETSRSEYAYVKESVHHLVSSVFCLLGSFVCRQITNQNIEIQSVSMRNKLVFDRFLNLVKQYHTEQRNVIFYANKLCISPKYLSKIVKSVSGFSAPQLIDRFVVSQARQLLKSSDSCIKEISEELNFPCPSFFYKYFKKHTGMTPKQYRES